MLQAILRNAQRGAIVLIRSFAKESNGASLKAKPTARSLLARVNEFAKTEGRQPRILIAKMDQGGNDPETMHAATSFADYGFDVDLGPHLQTPEEVARHAIDADVHVVGVRNVVINHLTLIPTLVEELAKLGRPDIPVVVVGDIPFKDHAKLYESGVTAIFYSGTDIVERASKTLDYIQTSFTPHRKGEASS